MRKIHFSILLLFLPFISLADSPITSIDLHKAYSDHKMVKAAGESDGVITENIMRYLCKKRKPIAVKMAIINKLSWKLEGKTNAELFWKYLKSKEKYKDTDDFYENGKPYELLCVAYLKAMDDYNNIDEAIKIAEIAKNMNEDSFTYNMIGAIIVAQKKMDTDWCSIYSLPNSVRTNNSLEKDMNEEAVSLIFEYVGLYKKYC